MAMSTLLATTAGSARIFAKSRQILTLNDLVTLPRRPFSSTAVFLKPTRTRTLSNGINQKLLGVTSLNLCSWRNVFASVIQRDDGYLVINYQNRDLELPYIWLRDNCRCETCCNHTTSQKNVDGYSLTDDIAPVHVDQDGRKLTLEWPGGHKTEYDIDWLVEHSYSTVSKSKTPFFLWDKKTMLGKPLPIVSYDDYRSDSEDGLRKTLYNLLSYGFSIIEGVDPSIKETQTAVERIAFLQETLFGRIGSFTSDLQHSDTAYTNVFLAAHTDTTYFNSPTGIQVFHCLWHDGKGGDSLLVDGFHAAEQFRHDHPSEFDFLTKAMVPHEYMEWDKHHVLSHGTILRVHPGSGEMMCIRFNPYDMAPVDTIPPEDLPHFYSAYSKLASYIRDPANEFWLKLHPGTVLLINNWRVLHGRASFTGRRVMCGCYLPRDDWMNKARMYKLV